ncbi:family 20 glycosylhydrolase [Weissella coleopterorum]|nr:family 20 glycosylhydrolase [Weissella coleopterorum]
MNYGHLENKQGLTIDIARHPLSKSELKILLKTAKKQHFDYVQLHLSDNENIGFQSKYLKNTTDQTALSSTELKQLVQYANKIDIQLVPDLDVPAHMGAILKQLQISHPKVYQKIKLDHETIDYTKPEALTFVKIIYDELNPIFAQQPNLNFVIGADEVPGNRSLHKQLVEFINQVNRHQNQFGFTNIVWNDQILKTELPKLDYNVIINYWSQSGNHTDINDQNLITERRKYYISVKDILREDRKIINSNSYVLYYQIRNIGNRNDDDFVINTLNDKWQTNIFNEIDPKSNNQNWTLEPQITTKGALFSLWGEKSNLITPQAIVNFIKRIEINKNHLGS